MFEVIPNVWSCLISESSMLLTRNLDLGCAKNELLAYDIPSIDCCFGKKFRGHCFS